MSLYFKVDATAEEREQRILTAGYIREIEIHNNILIPSGVAEICCSYYIIVYINMMVNATKPNQMQTLYRDNNDKVFEILKADSNAYTTIYHSIKPFGISKNKETYEWKVKCITYAVNDQIGIINEINHTNYMRYLFTIKSAEQNCYFWWGNMGIRRNRGDTLSSGPASRNPDWTNGDIIGIKLNTKTWTLEFIKNGKVMYEVVKLSNAEDDSVFYPIIRMDTNAKYYSYITK
eukprot:80438_1